MQGISIECIENGNEVVRRWLSEKAAIFKTGVAPAAIKRIIDGRTYNMATAQLIAYFAHKPGHEEYRYQWESLYQTRGGAYFLIGEGMSHTPWSAPMPGCNDRMRGHALLPLSEAEAKRWLELREMPAEYTEVFGEPVEAEACEFEGVEIRLPQSLVQELRSAAACHGQTIPQLVWSLLGPEIDTCHGT